MLYSYKKQYPNELPNRIRLSDGSTRTDKSSFTEEEILDAGYILVEEPPIVSGDDVLRWDGDNWVVEVIDETTKIARAWNKIRELRDGTIASVDWRVNRYFSEIRLGLETTDNIEELDKYIQELRNITNQEDPYNIVWPIYGPTNNPT